jgi:integrase
LSQVLPLSTEAEVMKWPKKVKRHGKVLAKIYRSQGRRGYRVCWQPAEGRRMMKSFANYSGPKGALLFAEGVVKEIAAGSDVVKLSPKQARVALAIFDALDAFHRKTGRAITPLQAVTEYLDAARRLGEQHTLSAAVTGYLANVATVRTVKLDAAVEEFLAGYTAKTKAPDGKRPQLSAQYAYMTGHFLRRFSAAFPGYDLDAITKDNLDLFLGSLADLSPKTRNHQRAALKLFFGWAVKKDYLPVTHRLLDAPAMQREKLTPGDTDHYRPDELRRLLAAADADLLPVLALGALGGLRPEEAQRLTWEDVFRVPGHIEVKPAKAKTRRRRLVEMVPALAAWLRPYQQRTGPLWPLGVDRYQERFGELRAELKIPSRPNGLRHAFCTYNFALHANENLTAQQAGNSPAMIHQHYKGLATRAEAEAWFAVKPVETPANIVNLPLAAGGAA